MRQLALFPARVTRCPSCGAPATVGPCVRYSAATCSHAILCERSGCAGGTESWNLSIGAAQHAKDRAA